MSQQLGLLHPPATTKSLWQAPSSIPQRKSRFGCGTCKSRRVKCDEGKPVCHRCRSTGRTCEGYGIMGGGGNTYLERYGMLTPVSSPPTAFNNPLVASSTHLELRYLELYKRRIVHTSSGWFGAEFWHSIVLPAASSEPAILHAAIALSASHRCNFDPSQDADSRERFVVQQYNKAICSLQPFLRYHDKASITVVLIACQIFTFLEYTRGRYDSAATHLQSGLRLLKDMVTDTNIAHGRSLEFVPYPRPKGIEEGIVRSFATLQMQALLFGSDIDDTSDCLYSIHNSIPYPTFTSIEEAKDFLDVLLHRIASISQHARKAGTGSDTTRHAISLAKQELYNHLTTWYFTYQRTVPEIQSRSRTLHQTPNKPLAFGTRSPPTPNPNTREPLAYTLLLMHHAMASIMCKSLLSHSETSYMIYTSDFLDLLKYTITIFNAYTLASSIPDNVNLHDSVSEYGFIAPLYYTAIKCRVSRIRRHAIRFLRTIPHKEGLWDAFVAADVAERVMRVEEEGVMGYAGGDGAFEIGDVPVLTEADLKRVPRGGLVWDVRIKMRDDGAEGEDKAVVTYKRLAGDGGWKVDDIVFCV